MFFKKMPPFYFKIFLAASVAFHFIFPFKRIIAYPFNLAGIALIALGVYLIAATIRIYRKKEMPIRPDEDPTRLETGGPFRFSRNPIYVGGVSFLLGVSVLLGSLSTFVFPAAMMIVLDRVFIPYEERNLERIFGTPYLDYKRSVRRWI